MTFFYAFLMQFLSSAHWSCGDAGNYRKWYYRSMRLPPPHQHDFHELLWVEEGEGIHRINGTLQILRPGDMVWVRARDAHSFAVRRTGGTFEFVNVSFRAELWEKLKAAHFPRRNTFDRIAKVEQRTHRLSSGQLQRLTVLAEDLRAGHTDELAVGSFLISALSMLTPRKSTARDSAPEWLRFACTQVAEHPNFVAGTAALVRLAGRSPEHVARACRRYYQQRPIDLINAARMTHAALLLRSSSQPVVDIAMECGVENLGHFYKLFHRRHGKSPVANRHHHQEEVFTA